MLVWSPANAPEYSLLATLDGATVRYQVAGPESGEPVVLVHGLTYPMEVWSPLFADLTAAGYRTCRYDLWGRGLSALPSKPLTLQTLCEQLLGVLRVAGITGPATLVSLSSSDLLVAELAATHPELVRSLLLLAPSGIDRRTMRPAARLLKHGRWLTPLLERRLRARLVARMRGHRAVAPEAARHRYDFSIRSAEESPAFAGAVLSQLGHLPDPRAVEQRWAALGKSELPISAIQFADEADSTNEGVRQLSRHLPRWRAVDLPGTHMGLLEQPSLVWHTVRAQLLTPADP